MQGTVLLAVTLGNVYPWLGTSYRGDWKAIERECPNSELSREQ